MSTSNFIKTLAALAGTSANYAMACANSNTHDDHNAENITPSEQVILYSMLGLLVLGCTLWCLYTRRRNHTYVENVVSTEALLSNQPDVEIALPEHTSNKQSTNKPRAK